MRLAIVALVAVGAALVAPAAALAREGQLKLALRPVGQPGSYFDLTMKPGETRTFKVIIANDGKTAVAAATYAADVYTITNGGFGGRLRDEPQTGATGWIDYPADVLQLDPGDSTRRSFTVAVPRSAAPGEYITSLVLENDQPILDPAAVGLNQIVRQAVAVVVTVPGRRSPGLAIGTAAHKVAAGRSIVQIAVENTGNIRLKPIVGFTLVDPAGTQISQATVQMDTFYAHTDAFVEFPLATLLPPGTYSVGLTLDDAGQGIRYGDGGDRLDRRCPGSGRRWRGRPSGTHRCDPRRRNVARVARGRPCRRHATHHRRGIAHPPWSTWVARLESMSSYAPARAIGRSVHRRRPRAGPAGPILPRPAGTDRVCGPGRRRLRRRATGTRPCGRRRFDGCVRSGCRICHPPGPIRKSGPGPPITRYQPRQSSAASAPF